MSNDSGDADEVSNHFTIPFAYYIQLKFHGLCWDSWNWQIGVGHPNQFPTAIPDSAY